MWPDRSRSDAAVERLGLLYLEALSDLSDGDLRTAAKMARQSCTFFPTAAELRALIGRPAGDDTVYNHRLVRERSRLAAGEQHKQITAPADPERVSRMIAQMLAEQRERAEQAKARDYWQSGRGNDDESRARRLAEYPRKAEADAILDALRATGPTPPPGINAIDPRHEMAPRAAYALHARLEKETPGASPTDAPGSTKVQPS
jgi:hypothetical protein